MLRYFALHVVTLFIFEATYDTIEVVYHNSVRIRENTDQKNFEYGHFSRSETFNTIITKKSIFTKIRVTFIYYRFIKL